MSRLRAVVLSLLPFVVFGCSRAKVTDFESWCAYVHDPKQGQYDIFSMDQAAVKGGVVTVWDRIIVDNSAGVFGISPDSALRDSVMAEMRKAHVVGAWSSADTIYLGLGLVSPTELVAGKSTADVYAAKYRANMERAAELTGQERMDPQTYCLYTGLNIFFAKVVVRTTDGTSAIESEVYRKLKKYK